MLKMRYWTRKSASIQPRTSPGKSAVSWLGTARNGLVLVQVPAGWRILGRLLYTQMPLVRKPGESEDGFAEFAAQTWPFG